MAKKLTSVVGIDIGSHTIKVAELRSKGRTPEVSALGMIATPEGAVDHTGVYNSDAVGDALKELLGQAGVTCGQAMVSIAGQASVLVRTLEVPRMNATELKEHMQWEISRNIPFAESNVVSDFKALSDEDPNSPNMDVVMAIAPQSAIDTLVASVKRGGRSAVGIDVEPLALARSLQVSYEEEFENLVVCVVDMGAKTTSINIYRSGKLLMPRQIPIGGENFTKAIADNLGISMEEAETLKTEKGVIPQSAIESAKAGGFEPTFGLPPAVSAPTGETQEFTPYNPFSDEPLPVMPTAFPEPETASEAPAYEPQAPGQFESEHVTEAPPFADETPHVPEAAPMVHEEEHAPIDFTPPAHEEPNFTSEPNPFEMVESPPAMSNAPVPVDNPEEARVFNAFASILEEFMAEVRRSIDYFRSKGGEVNRILLGGGGTKIRGLSEYVSASMSMECDQYDPFQHLTVSEKRVAPGFVDEHKQEFAVAIGTGLHIFFD